jgi:translation initiation factor 1
MIEACPHIADFPELSIRTFTCDLMPKLKHFNNQDGGLVYSTDPDYLADTDEEEPTAYLPPQQQNLRVHLLRLKGNKLATVIRDFRGSVAALETLGKAIKQKCGSGGTVKDHEIILQGDHRQTVAAYLDKEGYKYKFAGG